MSFIHWIWPSVSLIWYKMQKNSTSRSVLQTGSDMVYIIQNTAVNLQIPRHTTCRRAQYIILRRQQTATDRNIAGLLLVNADVTKLHDAAMRRCCLTLAESNSQNLRRKSEIDFGHKQKLQFIDLSQTQWIVVSRLVNNKQQSVVYITWHCFASLTITFSQNSHRIS